MIGNRLSNKEVEVPDTDLLKHCHNVITQALYSEDGIDPDAATTAIARLEGKMEKLGVASAQMTLERWWDVLCEAVGIDPGDELSPLPIAKQRLAEHAAPTDMLLFCPKCHAQHVDAPEGDWTNPPHKSHLCHGCGAIWRPCDRPTNGVERITSMGSADTWWLPK